MMELKVSRMFIPQSWERELRDWTSVPSKANMQFLSSRLWRRTSKRSPIVLKHSTLAQPGRTESGELKNNMKTLSSANFYQCQMYLIPTHSCQFYSSSHFLLVLVLIRYGHKRTDSLQHVILSIDFHVNQKRKARDAAEYI